jgi:nucleotide-binding universal stress UspA family protein
MTTHAQGAEQFKEQTMMKMLIAVDGSDHASRAIEAAAQLAAQLKAVEVLLLNVRDAMVYYGELPPFDFEAIERAQRQHQELLLEQALAQARACGLEHVSTQSAVGAPAQEIVRVAEERGVDQIVMGTHGRGVVGTLFLGSVAQRVVHQSKLPVLLVK